jgi:hypothetical protein
VAGRQEVGFASGCAVKASQYSSSCQAVSPEYSLAHVSVETLFGAGRTVIGIPCGFLFSSWISDSLWLIFQQTQADVRYHREYKQLSCQYKNRL